MTGKVKRTIFKESDGQVSWCNGSSWLAQTFNGNDLRGSTGIQKLNLKSHNHVSKRLRGNSHPKPNRCDEGTKIVRVISAEAIDNYKLRVLLSNNKKGIFDVSPYLDKGVFQELKELNYFRLVRVAYGGVMWPNEQDFSPETIEYELQQEQSPKKPF